VYGNATDGAPVKWVGLQTRPHLHAEVHQVSDVLSQDVPDKPVLPSFGAHHFPDFRVVDCKPLIRGGLLLLAPWVRAQTLVGCGIKRRKTRLSGLKGRLHWMQRLVFSGGLSLPLIGS
jgi:hypothetical protein